VTASSLAFDVRFDATGLVADAGLVLPATLAQHLSLPDLLRRHDRLGQGEGAANPDMNGMAVIACCWPGSHRRRPRRWALSCGRSLSPISQNRPLAIR
jgi:hypothetical protein